MGFCNSPIALTIASVPRLLADIVGVKEWSNEHPGKFGFQGIISMKLMSQVRGRDGPLKYERATAPFYRVEVLFIFKEMHEIASSPNSGMSRQIEWNFNTSHQGAKLSRQFTNYKFTN